jgi:hypothetical protein
MRYIYYIDDEKFTTDDKNEIPWEEISSPNEDTPAIQQLNSKYKLWCKKGFIGHRLTGVALIRTDGTEYFYLNDKRYENIKEWINNHPNPDLYFDALGMTETDKVLWFLQN